MQSIILSDVNDLYGWYIGDVIAGPFGDEKGEILLRKFKGHSFFCARMSESKFICAEP